MVTQVKSLNVTGVRESRMFAQQCQLQSHHGSNYNQLTYRKQAYFILRSGVEWSGVEWSDCILLNSTQLHTDSFVAARSELYAKGLRNPTLVSLCFIFSTRGRVSHNSRLRQSSSDNPLSLIFIVHYGVSVT